MNCRRAAMRFTFVAIVHGVTRGYCPHARNTNMKTFDQLTPEQKTKVMNRFVMRSVQKAYHGGLGSDQQFCDDVKRLVKETEERYFDTIGGGAFCGCSTCLEYLMRVIKEAKHGNVKEVILAHAEKSARETFYVDPGEPVEVI